MPESIVKTIPKRQQHQKFSLLFRRARGAKLLEARIIPERIEHRIEPETFLSFCSSTFKFTELLIMPVFDFCGQAIRTKAIGVE